MTGGGRAAIARASPSLAPPPTRRCKACASSTRATWLPRPFATVLLADFGADVIKLEHPKFGDGERKLEPIKELPDGEKVPLWWKNGARNKRCVTLDLSKAEGAALFKELVATADVVVENYRPGTFERWGLGYDELKQGEPKDHHVAHLRLRADGPVPGSRWLRAGCRSHGWTDQSHRRAGRPADDAGASHSAISSPASWGRGPY